MSKLSDNIEKARSVSRDRLSTARDTAAEIASETSTVAREKVSQGKARATEILGQSKEVVTERATAAKIVVKDKSQRAAELSSDSVQKSPLAFIAGGLVVGAVVAALLPRSKIEDKYVGSAKKKVGETARMAFDAAKEAGQEQIENLGLDSDIARSQFKDLFGKAIEAAKSAALAASDAVKTDKK